LIEIPKKFSIDKQFFILLRSVPKNAAERAYFCNLSMPGQRWRKEYIIGF